MFSDKNDFSNCFLEIHAGAGGTEAQDWALMYKECILDGLKKALRLKLLKKVLVMKRVLSQVH